MKRNLAAIAFILAIELGIIAAMVPRGTNDLPRTPSAAHEKSHVSTERGETDAFRIIVDGTPIDERISVASSVTGNSFYLSHDANGSRSPRGCVFSDYRCNDGNRHLLLYGHSFGYGTGMFTPLRRSWEADVFRSIGNARIFMSGEDITYRPLAALKVTSDFADIQRFSFTDTEDMRSWLRGLVAQSNASIQKSADEIARAQQVLTLVTCANAVPGQPQRTIVIFTSTNYERILPQPRR